MIEAPAHPENDRAIPLPNLAFDTKMLPEGTPRGRMIVRFDMDDHRTLQDVQVIYDDLGGVSDPLLSEVKERFALQFASEKQHRVVTYAVLELGDSINVVDHVVVLPKCCPICPPGDPFCHEP